MQFIPILPTKHLSMGVNHYMLSLAHLYWEAPYAKFFHRMHKTGHYIIMDNAAYELPEPLSISELWNLVTLYGASELVLPDVLKNRAATLEVTTVALDFLKTQNDKNPGSIAKY